MDSNESTSEIKYRPNVAAVLVDGDGRIFVAERDDISGAWQFPQGGVDPGESDLEALHREIEEEIGLTPDSYEVTERKGGYRYIYPGRRVKFGCRGQEQTYFLCRFKGTDAEINLDTDHPEFADFKWIRPEEFDLDWVPDFKREVYREVLRDFFG